jgi:hypothetical protein
MRVALALLMALHGVAHLVGFLVPWRLMTSEDAPYGTTVLAGRLDLGETGIRAFGMLWLLAGFAFWITAVGAVTNRPSWLGMAWFVASASLILSLFGLPDSRIGVPVNVLILAVLALGPRFGWL